MNRNGKSRFNAELIKFCDKHKIPYKVCTIEGKIDGKSYDSIIVDELEGREQTKRNESHE